MYRASAKFVVDRLELTEVGHRQSPPKEPPRPLFGSTTTVLASGSETESAYLLSGPPGSPNLSCWETGVPPPPVRGVSPAPCSTGSRTVAQICGASLQEPFLESPDAELSMCFGYLFVCSNLVPRVKGKYMVHQVETPYLVRLRLLLGGRLVSQGVPFETDSPTAIHHIGTALTP